MRSLLVLLLSFSALSAEYICEVNRYEIELDLTNDRSTHIWVRDSYRYNVITHGYAGSIERKSDKTDFYFYGQFEPTIITFKNDDLTQLPETIKAKVEAHFEGFYFVDPMICKKN